MTLKRGIERAVEAVTQSLKEMSKETKDPKEIAQVGTIAANNDPTIGEVIAEAMNKVGKEGVITVEERPKASTRRWRWSRACSSTAVTCPPTSSPIRNAWNACWTTATCSSTRRSSPT